MNFIQMILDVTLDQIRCHLVTHRPHKIPIHLTLPSSQILLHLRKFPKNITRRNTLQYSKNMNNLLHWRKTQKDIEMIRRHCNLFNLKSMTLGYLQEYLLHSPPHVFSLDPFPILRRPYQLIFRILKRIALHWILTQFHMPHFFRLRQKQLVSPHIGWRFKLYF